jgi:DNA-binding NarL/FixJ family response regulator
MREIAQQRMQRVHELVAAGLTKTEVANRVGLSVDRVRKIARKAAA